MTGERTARPEAHRAAEAQNPELVAVSGFEADEAAVVGSVLTSYEPDWSRDERCSHFDSSVPMVLVDDVKRLCASRDVDLVLRPARSPFQIQIQGMYDGYGEFFRILATNLEYIELASGVTVGDLRLTDVAALPGLANKWKVLPEDYSGPSLVIRSADATSWETARPNDLFVLIANDIVFEPGVDWLAAGGYRQPG